MMDDDAIASIAPFLIKYIRKDLDIAKAQGISEVSIKKQVLNDVNKYLQEIVAKAEVQDQPTLAIFTMHLIGFRLK